MKIGVVGIGSWGSRVAKEYLNLVEERVIDSIMICDTNEDRFKPFKGVKTFTSLEKLLENVDAIHICVNNDYHYPIAKQALENNIHVLVEKPMTTSSIDAYHLIELALERGLVLQVGHIFRFANVIRKTKELVCNNYFGKIYYFTLKWTTLMQPIKGVDIIWDLLPHPLDIIHFLTGKYPSGWQVTTKYYRREKFSELALINLDYGDFVANIELSWLTPERKRMMEMIGSDRMAKIECVKQEMNIITEDKKQSIPVKANNTIREEILNFIESIDSGKMPYNSHIIGAKNVDIIEEIIKEV